MLPVIGGLPTHPLLGHLAAAVPLTALLAILVVVWVALLTIALVGWWALHTPLFADVVATVPPSVRRIGIVVAGTATLVFAVACIWSVVLVGHSGTQAVWGALSC